MLEMLTSRIVEFRDARDWQQFHSPRSLAASISIEAAELLEVFQWAKDSELAELLSVRGAQIQEELADVIIYCLLLAHDANVDVEAAVLSKLEDNAKKYPVARSLGSSKKYTEL